jgi:hypothetical protein
MVNKGDKMKKNSGEIMVGLMVGLLIGSIALYITSGNEAQRLADMHGTPVHQADVIAEDPGKSAFVLFAPAIAGAGIGWALDEMSGGKGGNSSRDNDVRVDAYQGNVTISVSGDSRQDNDTTTRSDSNVQSGDGWRVE